jgi:radical SAM superfamily enzyme YgiQ (UPF0313 family)
LDRPRELNVTVKDRRRVRLKFALAYPSPYSAGISNLAVRLLYEVINNREDCLCERFFFSEYGVPPLSIESGAALGDFDIIGFSMQHEMDYPRMIDMLRSSGIPIESGARRSPVVIAGGPSASSNPAPLERFIDLFVIGEAEPVLGTMLDLAGGGDYASIRGLPGIYSRGGTAERLHVAALDDAYHSVRQVHTPSAEGFPGSFLLEISRGCSRGCRFCMECFLYRPRRQRSPGRIGAILDEGMPWMGSRRVTCISSSFFEHSGLIEILSSMRDRGLHFSLPSIRASDKGDELPALLAAGGQRSITLAPETPSERLREVINKRFDEDALLSCLSKYRAAGIASLKLYFMLGIPTETDADVECLKPLLGRIISAGFQPRSIHISVNPMIPKSNTPFQWAPMIKVDDYARRLKQLTRICSGLGIRRVESMDHRWGEVQAFLSTGGPTAADALRLMSEDIASGGRGDLGSWRRVLKTMGRRLGDLYAPWGIGDTLPWEAIKGSVPKSSLAREYIRSCGVADEGNR